MSIPKGVYRPTPPQTKAKISASNLKYPLISKELYGTKGQIGEIRHGFEIGKQPNRNLWVWAACEICYKERWVPKKTKLLHLCVHCCSHARKHPRGEKAHNWKGGYINLGGYHLVHLIQDDFFYPMTDQRGYIMEHRLVMAKHLGRRLEPWEIVHHENGIRADNRLENLVLYPSQGEHRTSIAFQHRINILEKRITLLESENVLLRQQLELAKEIK